MTKYIIKISTETFCIIYIWTDSLFHWYKLKYLSAKTHGIHLAVTSDSDGLDESASLKVLSSPMRGLSVASLV